MKGPVMLRLVKSLSSSEKRQFKMATKKQQQSKAYVFLFDLIDQSEQADWKQLKTAFKKNSLTLPWKAAPIICFSRSRMY